MKSHFYHLFLVVKHMERYSRHITLEEVGLEGQLKLNQAKVLVIGAGGLGCPALQYLVAAGIGTIGIIDHDVVEKSNLQRQTLFGTSSLGENKAKAAKNRLEDLNPEVQIIAYPFMLQPDNALELFKQYDVIVDGSDNFPTRYLVNDAALICNTPFVYGAIYKFEGQVSVFNYNNGPTYRCLFPEPPMANEAINCSEVGVLGVLPGIIGCMQANEVIKIILGFEDVLTGKLLCYDAKKASTYSIAVSKNEDVINKVLALQEHFVTRPFELSCDVNSEYEIKMGALKQFEHVQFLDVREVHEAPKLELQNSIQIPLDQLQNQINKINSAGTIICVCQSGIRSLKATKLLRHKNIRAFSLKGGVASLISKELLES